MSCTAPGKVMCRVRLDRGGYVPGESICLSALIENDSNSVIKKTRAVLTEVLILMNFVFKKINYRYYRPFNTPLKIKSFLMKPENWRQ